MENFRVLLVSLKLTIVFRGRYLNRFAERLFVRLCINLLISSFVNKRPGCKSSFVFVFCYVVASHRPFFMDNCRQSSRERRSSVKRQPIRYIIITRIQRIVRREKRNCGMLFCLFLAIR